MDYIKVCALAQQLTTYWLTLRRLSESASSVASMGGTSLTYDPCLHCWDLVMVYSNNGEGRADEIICSILDIT